MKNKYLIKKSVAVIAMSSGVVVGAGLNSKVALAMSSNQCEIGVLNIRGAVDEGFNDGHTPDMSIDNRFKDSSRWSAEGAPRWIQYDMGKEVAVSDIAIAWHKGSSRKSYFSVETSKNGDNWNQVSSGGGLESSGKTKKLETYELTDSNARYVKVVGNGNQYNNWNSIIETQILGCENKVVDGNPTEPPTNPDAGSSGSLDPTKSPSENFDLKDWYLSVPSDDNGDGKADSISEKKLNADYENKSYFYTNKKNGGMVFRATVGGAKTSSNTSFTRTELREMLRRGDTKIKTKGVNKNNWVFESAPQSAQKAAGGVGGTMTATLAVNHVTTTGSSKEVGRVIIGQIHANKDEPLRLYYRKLPNNQKGAIYFAHEPKGKKDIYRELIGSRSDKAKDPNDGIALNEKFSYKVTVKGDVLTVTISRKNKKDVSASVNMKNSGYSTSDQYHYFKAGVYNQNKTGKSDDFVKATFYALENKHEGYSY